MERLPFLGSGKVYMACCGNMICRGCVHAVQSRATKKEDDVCPFCRTPPPSSDEEMVKRYEVRSELNDAEAIFNLGSFYSLGSDGLQQNYAKALELWHRAGELGSAGAYFSIGNSYKFGRGVIVDKKKAKHYWELAAIGGDTTARHNLAVIEVEGVIGNNDRALKHFMIAAKDGYAKSLQNIEYFYKNGYATKDDYTEALRSYQAYLDDIKSDQRDEAAAYSDEYKYY